jgi:hypothetical protein
MDNLKQTEIDQSLLEILDVIQFWKRLTRTEDLMVSKVHLRLRLIRADVLGWLVMSQPPVTTVWI